MTETALQTEHDEDCAYVQRRQNCSCDYPLYLDALETVAQHMIASAVTEYAQDAWGDYPELGEFTWRDVVARAARLTGYPDPDEYEAAYKALSALAGVVS